MKKDYDKLIQTLRRFYKNSDLKNVEVFSGDINGKYDTLYNIDQKDVLDIIFSDGDIVQKDPDSRDVDNASYVCITRYKNDESNIADSDIDTIFLFVDEKNQKEFMFEFVQKDPELYQKVFDQNNYKGDISEYTDSNDSGYKIVPSSELIQKNKDRLESEIGPEHKGR